MDHFGPFFFLNFVTESELNVDIILVQLSVVLILFDSKKETILFSIVNCFFDPHD